MKVQKFKENIHNINSFLFIGLGFFIPLSPTIGSIFVVLITILWLLEGDFLNKFNILKRNPIAFAFLAFFFIHIIGLLWTENLEWGLMIAKKEWKFLAFIVFFTLVKKEHIKYYILAFLAAMSISELLSYGIWLEIIPPFKSASIYNPTPFMSHISYNPFLALSIFLLIYLLFFINLNKNLFFKFISLCFLFTMSINIFITGGRAGQVGFFVMVGLALFMYFKKNLKMATLLVLTIIPVIFFIAYNSSNIFYERVNLVKTNMLNLEKNRNTSVGLRITFAQNSLKIIKENLFFGVGTGDFKNEYEKINEKFTPQLKPTNQPHNMYILVLVQTGLFGLFIMLSIFYMQFKIALNKNDYKEIAIALPILYLVIMLSDSYLLGHHTTLLFVYFSSFLYREFNHETN